MSQPSSRACHPAPAPDSEGDRPAEPLQAVIDQLQQVLTSLTPDQYTRQPVGTFHSSLGGHVRHCLDHIEALIHDRTGPIDYDTRRRGTAVETDLQAAACEARRLHDALDRIEPADLDRPLAVILMQASDRPPSRWQSTLGRELAFVLSHTIHHGAMIAAMAEQMGVPVPAGFGLAPSTLAYREGR